jgi:excisionase family DNA binding protein
MELAPPAVRELPLLLKVEEAARLASLGRSTMFQLIAEGEIPAVRVGRAVRLRRTDLEDWISKRVGTAA